MRDGEGVLRIDPRGEIAPDEDAQAGDLARGEPRGDPPASGKSRGESRPLAVSAREFRTLGDIARCGLPVGDMVLARRGHGELTDVATPFPSAVAHVVKASGCWC